MYRREDIDRVRAATNLIDLVGAVTTVKRQGRTHVAICPFHQEKSPSLSLDPARGLYHCFGCGKGGDVYTFVQETQSLDFNEAVEFLARQAGIQIEADPGAAKRRGEHDELVEAVRRAVDFYRRRLKSGPDAGPARSYLRGRGIDTGTVDDYQIGYAPEEATWDALVKELRAGGVKDRAIEGAGLARRGRGGRIYDVFRSRVVFPIHDLRGDPIGFGGRAIGAATPKYLNSPESRLYQKSQLLYSLHRAKGAISRSGQAVVVEGYFDVIACHQAGVETAVATCGTALGEGHFDLLRRFSEKVVLAFDSDVAGSGAALKGGMLETPVRLDLDLRVAEMPDGMDPSDLVQAGRAPELAKAIENSRPMLQFRLEKEIAKFMAGSEIEIDRQERALRAVAPLLARLTGARRDEYTGFVAKRIGVDRVLVQRALTHPGDIGQPADVTPPAFERRERELVRVVLSNPRELDGVEIDIQWVTTPGLRNALEIVLKQRNSTAPGQPIDVTGLGEEVRALALDPTDIPPDALEVVALLKLRHLKSQFRELRRRLEMLPVNEQAGSDVYRDLIALQRELGELERP